MQARLVRWRGRLLLAITLLALAGLGFKIWRVYDRIQLVRQDARSIQMLARSQRDPALIAALGAQLAKTRGDTAALRAEAGMFLPITRYLGWVPVYGADLAAAEPLLDAAVDLSAAADDAFVAFGQLLIAPTDGAMAAGRLRERVAAARPQIDSALAALDRGAAAWSQIDIDTLSPRLRGQLAPIAQMLPLARLGRLGVHLIGDIVHRRRVLHIDRRMPAVVERQNADRADKPAGGAQLVGVLRQQQVFGRRIRAKQAW